MKQVTLREFQRSAYKYIQEVPLVLTHRGLSIAMIIAMPQEISKEEKQIATATAQQLGKTMVKTSPPKQRNPDIDNVITHLKDTFNLPRLDGSEKTNRQYAYTLLRKSKTGAAGVNWLIDLAAQDPWFRSHITSFRDLWNNQIKIVSLARKEAVKYVDGTNV